MQVKNWLIKSGVVLSLLAITQLVDAREGHGKHHRSHKVRFVIKTGADHKKWHHPIFNHQEVGYASYYHDRFHGRRTASGEKYDRNALTTQHAHLPFGTMIKVTNLQNHRSIQVKVNDRGGHVGKRILDLSHRAAKELGFISKGLAMVKVEVVSSPDVPG